MLNAKTVSMIKIPGNVVSHGAVRIKSLPDAIIPPHSGCGEGRRFLSIGFTFYHSMTSSSAERRVGLEEEERRTSHSFLTLLLLWQNIEIKSTAISAKQGGPFYRECFFMCLILSKTLSRIIECETFETICLRGGVVRMLLQDSLADTLSKHFCLP